MTYTAEQVEEAVQRLVDVDAVTWGEAEHWLPAGEYAIYGGRFQRREDYRPLLDINGESVYAEYVGGKLPKEGGGESVYIIFRVGDQLFRKNGYYASHYGTDWDGSVEEVRAVTKTVTVYETR